MRVVMLITSYHPIVGGAEKQLAQLAPLLREGGAEVHVVTRIHRGLPAEEIVDGTPVHRVGLAGAPKPIAATAFLAGAVRTVTALKPDVLHCHSLWSPALAGAIAKRLTGKPLLAKPMRGGEATKIAATFLGQARLKRLTHEVDRFVVISREIDSELAGLGVTAAKRVFIPNGVDLSRFQPADPIRRAAARLRFRIPQDQTIFVFAGRMSPQKRLPLLLDAWVASGLAERGATLAVAGADRAALEGSTGAATLKGLSAPGVYALGHVDDMPALLGAADAFVLPSASEGLSNALLEACASGLAVIASRVGGAMDFLEDGRNAILFDVDDGAALGAALVKLARDADFREQLGATARDTVAATYDLSATAASLLSLYRSLGASQ